MAEFCMIACFIQPGLEYGNFFNTDISQGSVVQQLRCGGIVNEDFVANILVNLTVKVFWKSVNIWQSYGPYFSCLFFIDSQCISTIMWFHVYVYIIYGCVLTIHILCFLVGAMFNVCDLGAARRLGRDSNDCTCTCRSHCSSETVECLNWCLLSSTYCGLPDFA